MMRMYSTRLCWSKSQVEQSIRESQNHLATLQASQQTGSDTVAQIENDIQLAQTRLTDLKAVIATKEAELAALEQAAANSPVQLSQATYEGYLQHLADNGNEAAASALALYKRGREEDGLTVGESGSLQANLRALEIADAINAYRRNAGLPELELDPYSLPASQVQLEYFKKPTGICLSICQTRTSLMASHLLVRLTFGTMKKRLIRK